MQDYEETAAGTKMITRWLDHRSKENGSFKTNVAVGAYVTAHARLMLVEKMEASEARHSHDRESTMI